MGNAGSTWEHERMELTDADKLPPEEAARSGARIRGRSHDTQVGSSLAGWPGATRLEWRAGLAALPAEGRWLRGACGLPPGAVRVPAEAGPRSLEGAGPHKMDV